MHTVVKNIGQMLTMRSGTDSDNGLGIIDNGAIVTSGDRITWLGFEDDLPSEFRTPETLTIDAENKVVLPGLVDAHTHLVFAGSRENEFAARLEGKTYEEILAAGGGIHSTVASTREATINTLIALGKKRLDFCIAHGITTVEIKSGYGLDTETEIKMLEAAKRLGAEHDVDVVTTFLGAHVVPREHANSRDKYIDTITAEMLPEVKQKGLATFCDVFIEEGAFSTKEAEKILSSAAGIELRPRLHVDQLHNIGGVELAVAYNAASVDHLETISEENIKQLADSEVTAVVLPGATFFLRMQQYAPARKLIDAGVRTAMATDFNPGSCMTAMPFLIMTLGCLQMGMTVPEVLKAFTVHAAYSLELHDRGVLEEGKKADIVILDVDTYEKIPYHFGKNHVKTVIKDGLVAVKH